MHFPVHEAVGRPGEQPWCCLVLLEAHIDAWPCSGEGAASYILCVRFLNVLSGQLRQPALAVGLVSCFLV